MASVAKQEDAISVSGTHDGLPKRVTKSMRRAYTNWRPRLPVTPSKWLVRTLWTAVVFLALIGLAAVLSLIALRGMRRMTV